METLDISKENIKMNKKDPENDQSESEGGEDLQDEDNASEKSRELEDANPKVSKKKRGPKTIPN